MTFSIISSNEYEDNECRMKQTKTKVRGSSTWLGSSDDTARRPSHLHNNPHNLSRSNREVSNKEVWTQRAARRTWKLRRVAASLWDHEGDAHHHHRGFPSLPFPSLRLPSLPPSSSPPPPSILHLHSQPYLRDLHRNLTKNLPPLSIMT